MRRIPILVAGLSVLLLVVLLGSCSNLVIAGNERVTFALVIDDTGLEGETVIARMHDHDATGAMVEEVTAAFQLVAGSGTTVTASMTTLEEIPTGQRYHAEFFIDMDANGDESVGDQTGVATFEVMPNAVHSSFNFFEADLFTIVP